MNLDQTLHTLFTSSVPRMFTSPDGLALSYNPASRQFRAGRVDHVPSATELVALRRTARNAGVVLNTSPAIHHMRATDGRTWHFAVWAVGQYVGRAFNGF